MLLSLSWLSEFVDLSGHSPDEIAHDLTMKTALIEGILRKGDLDRGIVIGKVLEKARHPQADRLSVCVVDVRTERLSIVCGAPNVAAGQTVAVATPGSRLPNGTTIARAKLRGVESSGMICSEQELQLSEEHGGILVLEDELLAGTSLCDVRGIRDVILEIDNKSITHRPDLWGHEGFARELGVIYGQPLKRAKVATGLSRERPGEGPFDVAIEASDLCGRYALLAVEGDLARPSPAWLRRRLVHCGLRPHSLLVDISNAMLLEIGQPTHPFDAAKIAGRTVRVRRANPGERMTTLDDMERVLPSNGLVIADDSGAIAIAGVMGGASSSISSSTRNAVIESAWFDPVSVRRTATAVGLRTDASARFEKNLDPALAERGVLRFAEWLATIAPDVAVRRSYALAGDREGRSARVALRPERLAKKLGIAIPMPRIVEVLERLEFTVTNSGATLDVTVPTFRSTRDVLAEDDVIEEVGRIVGYETVVASLPRTVTRAVELEPVNAAWRSASQFLRDHEGFAEVFSYPYADESQLARAGGGGDPSIHPAIEIKNPLQQNARMLRRSLVPALIEFVDRNVKQVEEVSLFECGRVFLPRVGDMDLPYEPQFLSAILAERSTKKDDSGGILRRLKGALETLAERLDRSLEFASVRGAVDDPFTPIPAWIHPGRASLVMVGNERIGILAEVNPSIAAGITKRGEIAAFEIDLTAWIESPRVSKRYVAVPKFQGVAIDLSFVAPFALRYTEVEGTLRQIGSLLRRIELVDEFFAPPIESGKRNLTLRLLFRSEERTLTAAEVQVEVEKARSLLTGLGVELRS